MPKVAKAFLAILTLLAGGTMLLAFATVKIGYLEHHISLVGIGIILLASGLTFFWTQIRFNKP